MVWGTEDGRIECVNFSNSTLLIPSFLFMFWQHTLTLTKPQFSRFTTTHLAENVEVPFLIKLNLANRLSDEHKFTTAPTGIDGHVSLSSASLAIAILRRPRCRHHCLCVRISQVARCNWLYFWKFRQRAVLLAHVYTSVEYFWILGMIRWTLWSASKSSPKMEHRAL